jgi:tRNA nucleotidyltransferase (CCA-adding enzyme)
MCGVTPDERKRTDEALETIEAALQKCPGLSVARIVKAGSAGKDTRVTEDSDLDIVVILNEFDETQCTL